MATTNKNNSDPGNPNRVGQPVDLLVVLSRRRRTVKQFLRTEGVTTVQHLNKLLRALEKTYVISDDFRAQAAQQVTCCVPPPLAPENNNNNNETETETEKAKSKKKSKKSKKSKKTTKGQDRTE